MASQKYRLVTRSDFDGLICGVLLTRLGVIDEIAFAHPKDMQDGKVAITSRDIITNLPYHPDAYMVLDHHDSEKTRAGTVRPNHVMESDAPSAARVVWKHYGGHQVFPASMDEMMAAVDAGDSAQYSIDDILEPRGWVLLNFLMDSRTGLGRFREFRVSNYQLMMDLITYCAEHSIDEILALPDVRERIELYHEHAARAREQILRCSRQHGNLVVLDTRAETTTWAVNRFMVYALFPSANISIHVLWGQQQQVTVFATGKSIIDRSSKTHVGNLMLEFGGGGHQAAGTCQVPNERAEQVLQTLIARINADG